MWRCSVTCTQAYHDAIKATPDWMREVCDFVGVTDFEGFDLLEMYNCPICHSTISLPGIGPIFEEESP
jgi:hypothetical protein